MSAIWLKRAQAPATLALVQPGQVAPGSPALASSHSHRLVVFLRHVGCPFAEHTVKRLRAWAPLHPQVDVLLISHADGPSSQQWLAAIGGLGSMRLVVDQARLLHNQWGLGESNFWHFAGPRSLLGVMALWPKGIRNRSAAGTRWQRAGVFFLVGEELAWSHVPASAQAFELPPESVLQALGLGSVAPD